MSDYPGFAGMEVVTKEQVRDSGAMAVPGVCVLTQDGEGPFLDTGTKIQPGPNEIHILLSVAKLRDMGRAIGMAPREDVEALEARVKELSELEAKALAWDALRATEPGLAGVS